MRSNQSGVSVSAAGISLEEVLTRKTIKIHSVGLEIHVFSEVFEDQSEFSELEKLFQKFCRYSGVVLTS